MPALYAVFAKEAILQPVRHLRPLGNSPFGIQFSCLQGAADEMVRLAENVKFFGHAELRELSGTNDHIIYEKELLLSFMADVQPLGADRKIFDSDQHLDPIPFQN